MNVSPTRRSGPGPGRSVDTPPVFSGSGRLGLAGLVDAETLRTVLEAGHTNRRIAGTSFISPKAVEANLSRVYQMLDIRARAQLGALLAERTRILVERLSALPSRNAAAPLAHGSGALARPWQTKS